MIDLFKTFIQAILWLRKASRRKRRKKEMDALIKDAREHPGAITIMSEGRIVLHAQIKPECAQKTKCEKFLEKFKRKKGGKL